ncbi:MAG: anhydro-N-acetylmuramic acid kinase [Cyanobacteriota bacterium]|nr:anhydro-N-acetylmuramic acid kinase [Cyanobacteriota bacterium]
MIRTIGLISGTSVDGIDAALVEITGRQADLQVRLLAGETYPYSPQMRSQILRVCAGEALSMAEFAQLDDAIACEFARAAIAIQTDRPPAELIGSHGQTVFHRPPSSTLGYSLQLGRGATIAHLTGLPTVSNFRAADIAAGGQGAPLVSPLDVCLFAHPKYHTCVQNLGGIGNLTYIPPTSDSRFRERVLGWDTGPGNALIDLAVTHLSGGERTFDRDGAWAASGTPREELVCQWLEHPFFDRNPPKSTGREMFGRAFFEECFAQMQECHLSAADTIATLTELTAASVALSYRQLPQMPDRILLCGGGAKNRYLKQRLQLHLESTQISTTDEMGLSADFKEAIAFAVLAYWHAGEIPGNLPSVTGATRAVVLGQMCPVAERSPRGIEY